MTQPTLGAPGSPDATVERVRYEHRASAEDRAASAQRAANKRMSDAHPELRQEAGTEEEHDAIEVRLVEEHADSAPADDPERRTRRAARRERRRLEKIAEQERKEKEAAQHLEDTARKMFYGGFFALPFLWLVSLIYFHKEHKAADANENIKKYYKYTIIMFTLYTAIFVAWVVVFQLRANTTFRSLNILHFKGKSPTNL